MTTPGVSVRPYAAYERGGGLGVTNLNYATTGSGDDYRRKHEISVKAGLHTLTPAYCVFALILVCRNNIELELQPPDP
jgi:hypothetical protein